MTFFCVPESVPFGATSEHLVVRPGGLALLGESGHALLLVLGGEEGLEEAALEAETLLERELEGWASALHCGWRKEVEVGLSR